MPSRALSVYLTFACVACTEPERPREAAPDPRRASESQELTEPSYRVVEVAEPGSIAGVISWSGERPEAPALPVRVHREQCGEQRSSALVISPRGGVADVVLSLTDVRQGVAREAPSDPPEMVHAGCRLAPRVVAVAVGEPVVFRNDDDLMHNIHGRRGDRTVWDFAQPERGALARRIVDAPGVVRVVCDVHSWTEGWVHAFEHPYFAVSDAEGRYRMTRVPPGQYVLRVWHQGWRLVGTEAGRPRFSNDVILTRTVNVSAQQETMLDFELSQASAEIAGD